MKLLLLSDTHGQNNLLEDLPEADVAIHCGDVTRYGSRDDLKEFASYFGEVKSTYKIIIAGNHDACLAKHRAYCEGILNLHHIAYLEDSSITIGGIKFWGMPWTPWFGTWHFMADNHVLVNKWSNIPNNVDVVISHGPPHRILDETAKGEHAGSPTQRGNVMHRIKPALNVFGHIHEAHGQTKKLFTDFINCSLLNERYEPTFQPVLYEIGE